MLIVLVALITGAFGGAISSVLIELMLNRRASEEIGDHDNVTHADDHRAS